MLNGTTAQFRATVSWSSVFKTCEVLLVEAVSHSPYPQRGGPGLCINDSRRQGGVCFKLLASQVVLKRSKQMEITGSEYSEMGRNFPAVDSSWNVMIHGDAGRGNWRMEWVASTLHTTTEHGVSSITTADAHTPAAIVDWTVAPADLNGLVRFAERRNLVSARVPSHFNWPLTSDKASWQYRTRWVPPL